MADDLTGAYPMGEGGPVMPSEPGFDLGGELTTLGRWAMSTRLSEAEQQAVLSPWLACLCNHVDGRLDEAVAALTALPDGASEALALAGYAAPREV